MKVFFEIIKMSRKKKMSKSNFKLLKKVEKTQATQQVQNDVIHVSWVTPQPNAVNHGIHSIHK